MPTVRKSQNNEPMKKPRRMSIRYSAKGGDEVSDSKPFGPREISDDSRLLELGFWDMLSRLFFEYIWVWVLVLLGIAVIIATTSSGVLMLLCPIAKIPIHGEITTYEDTLYDENGVAGYAASADSIISQLRLAESSAAVKGVLLEIDSYGGSPSGADEVARYIQTMTKPVISYIRGGGASAAYWIAIAGDAVVANSNADVGSIGVTSSYLDITESNRQSGKSFVELTTAPHKEYGNPDRPLSDAEREHIMDQMQVIHQQFVEWIAHRREMTVTEVAALANGYSWVAPKAHELGLVDRVGTIESALELLSMYLDEGESAYVLDDMCVPS